MKNFRTHSRTLLATASLLFSAIGCGAPETSIEILDYRAIDAAQGTWVQCEQNNAIEGKDISTSYSADGPVGAKTIIVHDSVGMMCAGPPLMTILHTMSITTGRDTNPVADTTPVDFYINSTQVQADDASYLATVQAMTGNGAAIVGTMYDITDYDAWITKQVFQPDDLIYSRFKFDTSVDPATMQEGLFNDDPTEDGKSEGTRIMTLDPLLFYQL